MVTTTTHLGSNSTATARHQPGVKPVGSTQSSDRPRLSATPAQARVTTAARTPGHHSNKSPATARPPHKAPAGPGAQPHLRRTSAAQDQRSTGPQLTTSATEAFARCVWTREERARGGEGRRAGGEGLALKGRAAGRPGGPPTPCR